MRWSFWLFGFEVLTLEQGEPAVIEVEGEPIPPGLSSDHFGFSGE